MSPEGPLLRTGESPLLELSSESEPEHDADDDDDDDEPELELSEWRIVGLLRSTLSATAATSG